MKICIFAETLKFDTRLYNTLCIRLLSECFSIYSPTIVEHIFDPGGHGQLIKQAPTLIDLYAYTNPDIDIFFIFRDSDDLTYFNRRRKIKAKFSREVKDFGLNSIVIACPQRNIEAWLLSDFSTINSITGLTLSIFDKAELIADPKKEFENVYDSTGKRDTIENFAYEIIKKIDINTLCDRSRAFYSFHNELVGLISRIEPSHRHRTH